jgi:isopentenyl phosphate kinase
LDAEQAKKAVVHGMGGFGHLGTSTGTTPEATA